MILALKVSYVSLVITEGVNAGLKFNVGERSPQGYVLELCHGTFGGIPQ